MSDPLPDTLEKLACGSLIQHGPASDRIYLMKAAPDFPAHLPDDLIALARARGYSKIFAKVAEPQAAVFLAKGFETEANVPGFYSGRDTALFMGFYLNPTRRQEAERTRIEDILQIALAKNPLVNLSPLDPRFVVQDCEPVDVTAMARIYREVFPSYPFPIHDPDYLLKTMQSHIAYFGVKADDEWVAISSAEMDVSASNVEMTDFATPPRWRGNHLAQHLLARMELEMKARQIQTAYTIARAMSAGMNVTFRKAGYALGGRLKNNTQISGRIESMNIWYRSLVEAELR
ncbi:MAG: putative beta-lysine N-acetyltransferase [Deltaproteobacteria bacterium]|jgi:putative beta-lysine N-acetyltransferase|nr:MAG: putative beta-lysine N-acetyltransferase [Deltaproteobacteria bacterium]